MKLIKNHPIFAPLFTQIEMKQKYFIILLLLISFTVSAQNKVTIHGTVYDSETKIGIKNVLVKIGHQKTVTNSNGKYILKDVYYNLNTINVSHIGFHSTSKKVNLERGKTYKYDFYLAELDNPLQEVVITGTRTKKTLANTPLLTKVISSKDIVETGSATAFDALQNVIPGIQFNPDPHGANMTIQGLGNDYVLVLVDGERLIGEVRGNVNLERISAENIKQIEVVNGASSVLYGSDAIGGVINIITKTPRKGLQGNISTRYGSYNTFNSDLNVGIKREKYSAQINLFRNSSNGYDLTSETPEEFTADKYLDYSVGGKFIYTPNKKMKIKANLTGFRHEVFHPEESLSAKHKLNKNYTASGKLEYTINQRQSLSLSANTDIFNSFLIYEKRNDSISKNSNFQHTKFDLIHRYSSKKIDLVNGAEFNLEKMFSATLFGENIPTADKNKYTNDINLFTQADWRVMKDLELVAGARYTHHSTFGNHFTPKVSIMYSFPHLKLRATGGLGYKSPSLRDLYYDFDHQGMFWIYGNKDLKPENSQYISLSTEYTYKKFNISINGYYNQVSNKINLIGTKDATTNKIEMRAQNIDKVEIKGLESNINWRFLSHFKFRLGYSFSDAKDKNTGLQIVGNSKHSGTTALTFDTRNTRYPYSFTFSGRVSSPRQYQTREFNLQTGQDKITVKEAEAYSIWKFVYIQQVPIKDSIYAELKLGVDNIFNYSNIKSNVLNPGRTYWGSLSIKF